MFSFKSLVLSSSSLGIRSSRSRWDTEPPACQTPAPPPPALGFSTSWMCSSAPADEHSKRCFSHRPWPTLTWPLLMPSAALREEFAFLYHVGINLPASTASFQTTASTYLMFYLCLSDFGGWLSVSGSQEAVQGKKTTYFSTNEGLKLVEMLFNGVLNDTRVLYFI